MSSKTNVVEIELETVARSPYAETPGASLPQTPTAASVRGRGSRESTSSPVYEPPTREMAPLAPADRGRSAWLFLLGATVIETTVWGLLNAVGVLQQYWMTDKFPDEAETVTLAASLMNGLCFCSTGICGPMFAMFPQHTRKFQIVGLVVSSVGLLTTAFATKASHLIGTVGILYPFSSALYLPCATIIYEWFYDRRGFATGVMFAGTGVGGTVFPIIIDGLRKKFGYKATMISLALGFFALNASSLIFIRRRIPLAPSVHGHLPRVEWRVGLTWAFWCGFIVLLFTSLGNFNPTLWIPTFADNVGATKPGGVALVSIMNAASVPGNALIGYLSDRVPTRVMNFMTCLIGTLAVLLLWGLGTTTPPLIIFSVVWGMSALCFVSLWSSLIRRICKDDPTMSVLMFSLFGMLRGVGNLTSGPLSTQLLKTSVFRGAAGAYGKTNFGAVLIYTAATTFVGGAVGAFFPS